MQVEFLCLLEALRDSLRFGYETFPVSGVSNWESWRARIGPAPAKRFGRRDEDDYCCC